MKNADLSIFAPYSLGLNEVSVLPETEVVQFWLNSVWTYGNMPMLIPEIFSVLAETSFATGFATNGRCCSTSLTRFRQG